MKIFVTRLLLVLAAWALHCSSDTAPSGLDQHVDNEPARTADKVTVLTTSEGISEFDSVAALDVDINTPSSSYIDNKKKDTLASTPRKVKMLLSKGKEYYGFVVDKVMHGKGTLRYADGTVYEGDFVDNKRHGHGRIRYASGEEYRGEWYKGFMTGKGTYNFQDGSVYTVCICGSYYIYIRLLLHLLEHSMLILGQCKCL